MNPKQPELPETQEIRKWLKQVKFRSRLIGGVDETDVWKKIDELNALYEKALVAERARYDALLQRQKMEFKAYMNRNFPREVDGNGRKG